MRHVILIVITLLTSTAFAEIRFQQFLWKADGGVEIRYSSGKKMMLTKGYVREGQTAEISQSPVAINVVAFSGAFVGLAFAENGAENGSLVILERHNAQYLPITAMISGPASSLVTDLKASVEGLQKTKRWDHSLALRALSSYFRANPKATLRDFSDSVEQKQIGVVAKPSPKGSPSPMQAANRSATRRSGRTSTRPLPAADNSPTRPVPPAPAANAPVSSASGQQTANTNAAPVQRAPPRKTQPTTQRAAKPTQRTQPQRTQQQPASNGLFNWFWR